MQEQYVQMAVFYFIHLSVLYNSESRTWELGPCTVPPHPLYFYADVNTRKMSPLLSFITKQHKTLINKMCGISLH